MVIKINKGNIANKFENFNNNAKNFTSNISDKTKKIVKKSTDKVVTTIDANGDGNIDIEDIIIMG